MRIAAQVVDRRAEERSSKPMPGDAGPRRGWCCGPGSSCSLLRATRTWRLPAGSPWCRAPPLVGAPAFFTPASPACSTMRPGLAAGPVHPGRNGGAGGRKTTQEKTSPCDPLEHALHGRRGRHQRSQRAPHLARARTEAAPRANLQAEQRSPFAEKLEDIVGLYLNPPEHALVLSLDEKSQIQALDRTQPGLPMKTGRAQTMTHDYKRHGTTTLFAALNTLDGKRDGHLYAPPSPSRVAEVPAPDRSADPARQATASHRRQLRHAQTPRSAALGRAPQTVPLPLHAHQQQLAQHGGTLLSRPNRKPTPARRLHQRRRAATAILDYIEQHNRAPKPFIWTAKATRHPGKSQARQSRTS